MSETVLRSATREVRIDRSALRVVQRVQQVLGCKTVGGASNVSMGLPGRPQLNATFVAMLIGAGMRCVIANPLDEMLRWTVLASDTLIGADEDCVTWLRTQRQAATSVAPVPETIPPTNR